MGKLFALFLVALGVLNVGAKQKKIELSGT